MFNAPCSTCGSAEIDFRDIEVKDGYIRHCICTVCLQEWVE